MHIKRFTANNMTDALALVKQALGDDAVILANRRVEGENGESHIEVTAATDSVSEGAQSSSSVAQKAEHAQQKKPLKKFPIISLNWNTMPPTCKNCWINTVFCPTFQNGLTTR